MAVEPTSRRTSKVAAFTAIGAGVGAAIGVATGNIAGATALGAGMGAAVGYHLAKRAALRRTHGKDAARSDGADRHG